MPFLKLLDNSKIIYLIKLLFLVKHSLNRHYSLISHWIPWQLTMQGVST